MSHQERIQKLETARRMVASLEEQMATGAGVMMVSVDGNMVQYNRDQAIKELEYWRKQVVRYSRSKSRFSSFNLGNSHD
jgi:hypothetical protein